VEIGMAGKARERFREIEAQGPQAAPLPGKHEQKPSKWDKKEESTAEVVNRRVVQDDSGEEDEEFDVKHLMSKFKNIADSAPSRIEKKLDELEALRVEAKNLRERFEKSTAAEEEELSEEKRRQLEEEFKYLKEERERAKQELEAERAQAEAEQDADKEDIQIAADHASKMAAKWERIQQKEARKAEKSKMPQRPGN